MDIESVKSSNTSSYQGSATVDTKNTVQNFQTTSDAEKGSVKTSTEVTRDHQEEERRIPQGTQIKQAVDDLNKRMTNSEAIFGIHDKTNRVVIKIVDKSTKEVIKEYPPEKTLDMIAKVWELAGILVDEKG